MVSAEAAAVGRPARFDVRGGALKLAGRLFRGALRVGAEGKLRARSPALQGVWPGGPARDARESPPQSGVRGVRGPGGEDFSKWQLASGVESPWVWMSPGVRVHASAFGRWDERVVAFPVYPPHPSPPPPTSLRSRLPLPTAGPRLGARSAGGGSV